MQNLPSETSKNGLLEVRLLSIGSESGRDYDPETAVDIRHVDWLETKYNLRVDLHGGIDICIETFDTETVNETIYPEDDYSSHYGELIKNRRISCECSYNASSSFAHSGYKDLQQVKVTDQDLLKEIVSSFDTKKENDVFTIPYPQEKIDLLFKTAFQIKLKSKIHLIHEELKKPKPQLSEQDQKLVTDDTTEDKPALLIPELLTKGKTNRKDEGTLGC